MAADMDAALKEWAATVGTDVGTALKRTMTPGPAGTSLNTVVIPKGSTDIPNGTPPNSVVIRLTS
jgi:hypothetical protein